MQNENTLQLNIPEIESNIYILPSNFCRQRRGNALPVSALFIAAEINSFSGRQMSYGISECRRTYEKFKRDLGLSISTVYRNVKKLTSCELVKRPSQSGYIYQADNSLTFLRVEAYILKTEFKLRPIADRQLPPILRRLTPTESLVFAYFYTRCNDKKRSSEITRSISEIASELGIGKKSAWTAINNLKEAKFIYRSERGVNTHQKSVYGVSAAFKNRLKAYKKEIAKSRQKADKAAAQATQAREREQWLEENRQAAIARAERNERLMAADPEFKVADCEWRGIQIDIAFAEVRNAPNLPELMRRADELQGIRQVRLIAHRLTDIDLSPQYHCKKCEDTGFDSGGKLCDCYERWRKGGAK